MCASHDDRRIAPLMSVSGQKQTFRKGSKRHPTDVWILGGKGEKIEAQCALKLLLALYGLLGHRLLH